MNRLEALRILGLDEDATLDEIKTAYKEMAQILHPDRFASNKKLEERATEQFKNLQEAHDYLLKNSTGKRKGSQSASANPAQEVYSDYEARIAGIAAARTQLVAQRDAIMDERKTGFIIAGVGLVVVLFFKVTPIGALGSTAIMFGIVQAIRAQANIENLNEHIEKLRKMQKDITDEYE